MLTALLSVLSGGLNALINAGCSWWQNRQNQANRPDIIKAKEAQIQQDARDRDAQTIGDAMHPETDAKAAQQALEELRKEAAE